MSVKRKVTVEPDTRISICRLCALVSGSKSFIPLYLNKEEQDITKEINQLVPNIISSNDGLPQEVCFKCADTVNKCLKFINSVIETQDKLRQMIRLSDDKLNDISPSPNQFLENDDQWSTGAGEHYASRTRTGGVREKTGRTGQEVNASDKISASKTPPSKKSVNLRVESSSSSSSSAVNRADVNAKETYMKRLKSCAFKPVPSDAGKTNSVPEPKRLFRCGICYEKFDEKDSCLAHIAEKHAGVKKPVLPNTIFETVRKGELDKNDAEPANANADAGRTPTTKANSKGVASARAPAKQLTNGEAEKVGGAGDCESPQPPPPKKRRPGTRGRKVLAIDSFFAEMNQPCTRYICDECGRMMMSRFAFLRHLHDHREAEKSAPAESEEAARPKRLPRGTRFYCNTCKKSVRDGQRHRMYHTIVKLESKFPVAASMLANMATSRR